AADLAGNISAASNIVTTNTLDIIAPSVPANLRASNITGTSLVLNWDNSTDNVGVTRYDVFVNGVKRDTSSVPSYTVTNLISNTAYTFTVQAADLAANISALSVALTATTADITPPTIPDNLKASNITGTSVTLNWDNSIDNVG